MLSCCSPKCPNPFFKEGAADRDMESLVGELWAKLNLYKHEQECVTTPRPRALLKVPEHTPPPVLQPCKKFQLMAAKRMEAQMKQAEEKKKEKRSTAEGQEANLSRKSKAASRKAKPSKKAKQQKAGPENGPVYKTYQAFLCECKSHGMSHSESVKAWEGSDERAAIVNSMTEAERKKRRY